jgi:hypothetical protein
VCFVKQSAHRSHVLRAMREGHGIAEKVADHVISAEEYGRVRMATTQRQKLELGETAPDFRLPSTQGTDVALSDFRGHKHVVLAFLRGMT